MKYNAGVQWLKFEKDLKELESDEELIITVGKRKFVIREANAQDVKNHGKEAESNA